MDKIIHKIALIAGVRDIFFAIPLGGHVKVKWVEICYDTFTKEAGEILCRSKGLQYDSYSRFMNLKL